MKFLFVMLLACRLAAAAPDAGLEAEGDEVTIVAARDRALSSSTIQADQVRRIAGAAGDALRAIKALPGVAALSDFSGQLSVRGGAPEDNKYYLDGMPWPVPYHFGGVLTTVNADLLDSVELMAGGFPARWGNATGAVIEAKTRPGKPAFGGNADINLVTGSLLAEGPLGPKASWTLSGRRSYFDLVLPKVIDLNGTALPYFWDLGGTLDYAFSPFNRLKGLVMATDDQLAIVLKKEDLHSAEFAGELRFHNRFLAAGLAWEAEAGPLKSHATLYYNDTAFESAFGQGYSLSAQPKVAGLKEEAELSWGAERLGFGGGGEFTRQSVNGYTFARTHSASPGSFTATDPRGITITSDLGTDYAYLQDRWEIVPSLRLTLGLRYDSLWRGLDALTPRSNLEWEPRRGTVARLAWGLFSQSPTPRQLNADFGNPQLGLIIAEHQVAGLEQRLGPSLLARLEGYLKAWRGLVSEVPDSRIYANDGEGRASGIEFFLNYDDKSRYFGWISAAWSHSERKDAPGLPWRYYVYDQPLTLSLVGNARLTRRLDFGATLAWHSGNLITPITGGIYDPAKDSWSPIYGDALSQRMPDYLRLDLKAEYQWIFRAWKLSAYLEVLNVTGSLNAIDREYSRDYSSYTDAGQIPRLPYFGLTASF